MDEDPLATFGASMRRVRTELGLTQEQVSLECGLARSYVGDVERGTRNVSLVNIVRIAAALRTTPSVLVADL